MTKKKGFIPARDGDKKIWASNLDTKLSIYGATLGLTSAEVTTMQDACNDLNKQINDLAIAKQTFAQAASFKLSKVKENEALLRTFIKRMKTNAAYTDAIGKDLGVIGEDITVDVANSKPVLVASKVPQGWKFDFNLQGYFDGVNIYKKIPTETTPHFLARDTASPYIDTQAVENRTEYTAYYVLGDDEVGLLSDVVVISV